MTQFSWCCLLLSALLLAAGSTYAEEHHHEQPEEVINRVVDGLHADAAGALFTSYFDRFAPDAVFLGTDRTERWSIEEFKAYAKPIFDSGKGWRYEVVERNLSGEEGIYWFDEVLYNQKYGYCRGTGVVRKNSEGDWKIAHYSLTFLVPNGVANELGELVLSMDAAPK